MNVLLLHPTDVLFFRDGRPMGGSSAGHGAAWPLPSVVNHALHAALHRAGDIFKNAHSHRRGRSGVYEATRDRRFGSLNTAGPFPVEFTNTDHIWYFPRPADSDNSGNVLIYPHDTIVSCSLPAPYLYPVVSTKPPSKDPPKPWWSEGAWNAYLGSTQRSNNAAHQSYRRDSEFTDAEHTYGIALDPNTGTVEEGRFYSANYLRLRENWRLGLFATAADPDLRHSEYGNDLVRILLNGHGGAIIVGGQQRSCTVTIETLSSTRLPLPLGRSEDLSTAVIDGQPRTLVKWVLLSPAIWPEIPAGESKRGTERRYHQGGWLPNWICPETGDVLLETVTKDERRRRRRLNYDGKRYVSNPSRTARLVAAVVPKPVAVTGWALPNEAAENPEGGAKSTHLAVPAGAVYYFECDDNSEAKKLANALNWHGDTQGTEIRNRRSTLLGEKGFGLGVCGTWNFHEKSA